MSGIKNSFGVFPSSAASCNQVSSTYSLPRGLQTRTFDPSSQKVILFGYGAVARCVLPLLLQDCGFVARIITVIDAEDRSDELKSFIASGGTFVCRTLKGTNIEETLAEFAKAGDLVIDLTYGLSVFTFVDWCQNNQVKYVNASAETEPVDGDFDPTADSLYSIYNELYKRKAESGATPRTTAIIGHGANPGLVSHFTKRGLFDFSSYLLTQNIRPTERAAILQARSERNFAELANACGIKVIHISEKDTQDDFAKRKDGEFVNSWSIPAMIEEANVPSEICLGTHERQLPLGTYVPDYGTCNQVTLPENGGKVKLKSFVPSGEIEGYAFRHEETVTISDFLSIWKNNVLTYRPTIAFAYQPSKNASASLEENILIGTEDSHSLYRVMRSEIVSGADELGCLFIGSRFGTWWTGSILSIEESRKTLPDENATVMQVGAGVVAGALYACTYPEQGLCFPEELDEAWVLERVSKYLGQLYSGLVATDGILSASTSFQLSEFLKTPLPMTDDRGNTKDDQVRMASKGEGSATS